MLRWSTHVTTGLPGFITELFLDIPVLSRSTEQQNRLTVDADIKLIAVQRWQESDFIAASFKKN